MYKRQDEIHILEPSIYEAPVVLAMPKKNSALIPLINDAIRSIEEKGQLEKIQQRWFGISTPLIINKSGVQTINEPHPVKRTVKKYKFFLASS